MIGVHSNRAVVAQGDAAFAPRPVRARESYLRFVAVALISLLALGGGVGCRKKSPEERLQEIQQLFGERKFVNAVLKSKELVRDHPDSDAAHEARFGLALYYYQTGDLDRAHEYLGDIYKVTGLDDMRGAQALMQDVGLYRMQEDYASGLAVIDWALETLPHDSPTSGEFLLMKADLLTASDNPETGEALFRTIMRNASQAGLRHQARELLANHYRQQEAWDKVVATYDEYEATFFDDDLKPHFEIARGMARLKAGDNEAGTTEFERGIAALEADAHEELEQNRALNAWIDIAQYYMAAERYDKAEATFQDIRERFPQHPRAAEAGLLIGDLRIHAERYEEALAAYEEVRAANPHGPMAAHAAQRIQQTRHRMEQAKADADAPNDAEDATDPDDDSTVSPDDAAAGAE